MGRTVEAKIVYGYRLGEVCVPWDRYSEESWWREVNGFKHSIVIHDENQPTGYINNVRPSQDIFDQYWDEERDWDKANPLPVKVVNAGSQNCEHIVLALPKLVTWADWGEPEVFDPWSLSSILSGMTQERQAMIDFCKKYLATSEELEDCGVNWDEPEWILCAYGD